MRAILGVHACVSEVHGLSKIMENILFVLIINFLRRGFKTLPQFFKRGLLTLKRKVLIGSFRGHLDANISLEVIVTNSFSNS